MAFSSNRFVRQTTAYNAGQITTTFNPDAGAVIENGPAWFTYASATDAIATIAAANYFADVVYDLSVNDRIDVTGSDASNFYLVSAVDRDAGTVSVVSYAATGVVGTANIQDGAVTTAKIADGAVTAAKIADLSIENADISATAAIDFSKLATLASTNILVGSGAGVATSRTVTGDVTIGNTGVTAIAAGVIVNADISATAQIAYSKLADLTSTQIIVGSAGNVPTAVAVTGDVTIGNTGVTAIGASKVLSSMVSPLLMKYAAVAITAAEFNGMYAAPKLLLAAGGANTMIILHRVDLLMTYVSANYAAGGVAAVQYDSTANGAGVIASTTLSAATFQAAASTGFMFNTGVVAQTFSTCVNKGLYLSNITGAFTTGDSTFVAHVYYSIVPTVQGYTLWPKAR